MDEKAIAQAVKETVGKKKPKVDKDNGAKETGDANLIFVHQKKSETVCIVGYAPSSKDLAPYNDKDVEIWGMNELYTIVPRIDVLFEMHEYPLLKTKIRNPKHLEWLQKAQIPIYMLEHFADIPNSIAYPLDVLIKQFGNYFTNSVSYMIALAVIMQYKKMYVYGVDMATDSEYGIQRPSVEYFLGIAKGAGIELIIPPQADILRFPFLYGYESTRQSEFKLKLDGREQELTGRVNQANQQIQQKQVELANLEAQKHQFLGALDDLRYFKRTWINQNKDVSNVPEKT